MAERSTLTRSEACDLIQNAQTFAHTEAERLADLTALHKQWIGHAEHGCTTSADLEAYLYEYVDEACNEGPNADDIRERGDRCSEADNDDTGISADEPQTPEERAAICSKSNQLTALSEVLRFWCSANDIPFSCADELRHTHKGLTLAQHHWLDAYCSLWDITNA